MNREHHLRHTLMEKHRVEKISQIRELIFGVQDGLLGTLGVVTGVASAFGSRHIVLVAGVAGGFAGSISMTVGSFLASQAERQVHLAEIAKEKEAVVNVPQEEEEELRFLFMADGMPEQDAKEVVKKLARSPEAFMNTMVQKELGIEPEPAGAPGRDAILVGVSYIISAVIPLVPYVFFTGYMAMGISVGATLITLFGIGVVKGKVADLPYVASGLQIMLAGAASGIGGYLLGTWLPHLLGIK